MSGVKMFGVIGNDDRPARKQCSHRHPLTSTVHKRSARESNKVGSHRVDEVLDCLGLASGVEALDNGVSISPHDCPRSSCCSPCEHKVQIVSTRLGRRLAR